MGRDRWGVVIWNSSVSDVRRWEEAFVVVFFPSLFFFVFFGVRILGVFNPSQDDERKILVEKSYS